MQKQASVRHNDVADNLPAEMITYGLQGVFKRRGDENITNYYFNNVKIGGLYKMFSERFLAEQSKLVSTVNDDSGDYLWISNLSCQVVDKLEKYNSKMVMKNLLLLKKKVNNSNGRSR